MREWIEVGQLDDIPCLGTRLITTAKGAIALFRTGDDQVFALDNRCPHKGGPLSEGIVHGRQVTCPLHNWVIDLESGQAAAPDCGCTQNVPVRLEGGAIWLEIDVRLKVVHG